MLAAMGSASDGSKGFCFALPPSLGKEPVKELARGFADVLYEIGFTTVVPSKSYTDIEQSLLSGEVDAAWGPPIVCARVEDAGGPVALRAVRYGAVTYRSVLVCRAHHDIDIKNLGQPGGRPLRAVWVDKWSMGGYILPRHHLRSRGVDLDAAFSDERMLGSYDACFKELLEGEADISASFAGRRGLGYVELCGDQAFLLRTLAYTEECPNDGIVLSPKLDPETSQKLVTGLQSLISQEKTSEVLAGMFDVDGFDRPQGGTYSPLLELL
jgi:ABC-type phosphate/phosphonate transport system substrate-binding protein